MKDSDIEFSVGLNISPAEQNLNNLFKDTQTAHNRLQKLLNEQPSNLVYESKLKKLENIMTRYGVFSVSQANASQMPKNEFYRFQKLFHDVKAYERNERKYHDITTKILSSVQQYQGLSAKPTPFQETFKQMYIDSQLKEREQKEIYSPKAHGMYDIWKNIVNKPTMLALPAPAQTNKAVDGGKVVTEEKIEKTEEKTNEENKGVTEEIKKQHRGLLDNLANWLKIYAVIRLVHRAINTAINLWKGFGNVSSETFNITRDQAGNFFADPVGTMRSGIDFTRARIRAGLRAWASAGSPLLNVDAIDTASASLVAVANNAMSGNEVDKNKAIAARAVFDTLGTILNSEMLLTGNTKGYSYTDLVVDLMDKFETFMSDPEKWKSLGTVKQNQFMQYLIDLLGKDIPNAVVDNVNLNKQMKDWEEFHKNKAKNVDYYLEKAAKAGHSVAQYRMGKMFYYGIIYREDEYEAQKWLSESVGNGNKYADALLGKLYVESDLFGEFRNEGFSHLFNAERNGSEFAAYTLGKYYMDGKHVKKDIAKAIEHLEIASARGNMYADYRLAQIYLFEADIFDMEKALEYLNRSAHAGNESAALALTRMANNQFLAITTNVLDLVGSLASIESYRQPQDCTTMPISRKERKKHEWEQSM